MKKALTGITIFVLALALLGGLAFAQSTYVEPPEPEPDVPADWEKIDILDKHEIFLSLENPEEILTATVPEEYEPYELSWYSEDTDVATVTAMSQARVTRQGVGGTWVVARVDTDDGTYYDACAVKVLDEEEPAPTPPTAGGMNTTIYSLIGLALMLAALPVYKKLQQQR